MRTTLDIDPELVKRVVEATGEKRKGKAVDKALEEFLRRRAIEELLAARGTFDIEDRTEEWEAEELRLEKECRNDQRW